MKILMVLLMVISNIVYAGERGNGGVGMVCVTNGEIEKVVLYDFAEGKAFHKDDISADDGRSMDEYLRSVYTKIEAAHPYLRIMLEKEVEYITSNKVWQQGAFEIDQTADTLNYGFKIRVCNDPTQQSELHQVANFMDEIQSLRIDDLYFSKMDNLNKAGLIVHEALYRVERTFFNVNDSKRVRRMTSMLFSVNSNTSAELSSHLSDYNKKVFLEQLNIKTTEYFHYVNKQPSFQFAREVIKNDVIKLNYGVEVDLGLEELDLFRIYTSQVLSKNYETKKSLFEDVFNFGFILPPLVGSGIAGVASVMIGPGALATLPLTVLILSGGVSIAFIVNDVSDAVNYKKIKNLKEVIDSSKLCSTRPDNCSGNALLKFHKRFVNKYYDISIFDYSNKVMKAVYSGKIFKIGENKAERKPFITVKSLNKVISESY